MRGRHSHLVPPYVSSLRARVLASHRVTRPCHCLDLPYALRRRLYARLTQILLRLVRGEGFGDAAPGSKAPSSSAASGRAAAGTASTSSGSPVFRQLLVECLRPADGPVQPFLNRLFNMTNWATSEFAATGAEAGLFAPHGRCEVHRLRECRALHGMGSTGRSLLPPHA